MSATWNHYTCEACGAVTIAKHEDEGVTPFMLRCRATSGCREIATSGMYRGPQDDDQVPHIIWYRPKTAAELEAALAPMSDRARVSTREHYEKGGALLRECVPT